MKIGKRCRLNVSLISINLDDRIIGLAPQILKSYYESASNSNGGVSIEIKDYSVDDDLDWMIRDALESSSPDIIGFSCYLWNKDIIIAFTELIRQYHPKCLLIIGGPGFYLNMDEFHTRNRLFNVGFIGNSEYSFKCFLDECSVDRNFTKYSTGSLTLLEDRGAPSYDVIRNYPLNFIDYLKIFTTLKGSASISYETTRGCNKRCSYCAWSKQTGCRILSKNAEHVSREIDFLLNTGIEHLYFIDPDILSDKIKFKKIADTINHHPDTKCRVHFEADAHSLDDATIKTIATLGRNVSFGFGLQSTNERALKCINRRANTPALYKQIKKCTKRNLKAHTYLHVILGLPEDSLRTFLKTIECVLNMNPSGFIVYHLRCLPGTKLFDDSRRFGLIFDTEQQYKVCSTPDMDTTCFKRLSHICNWIQLLHTFDYLREVLFLIATRQGGKGILDNYLDLLDDLARDVDFNKYDVGTDLIEAWSREYKWKLTDLRLHKFIGRNVVLYLCRARLWQYLLYFQKLYLKYLLQIGQNVRDFYIAKGFSGAAIKESIYICGYGNKGNLRCKQSNATLYIEGAKRRSQDFISVYDFLDIDYRTLP